MNKKATVILSDVRATAERAARAESKDPEDATNTIVAVGFFHQAVSNYLLVVLNSAINLHDWGGAGSSHNSACSDCREIVGELFVKDYALGMVLWA